MDFSHAEPGQNMKSVSEYGYCLVKKYTFNYSKGMSHAIGQFCQKQETLNSTQGE